MSAGLLSELVGVVLAGGRATRMGGRQKAWLTWRGRPLIEHVLAALRPLTVAQWISTNEPDAFAALGLPLVTDLFADCGPLAGIQAALSAVGRPILTLPCDVPRIRATDLQPLLDCAAAGRHDIVLYRHAAGCEPLCGFFGPACLQPATALLQTGRRCVLDLFALVSTRILDFDGDSAVFANINAPQDWQRLQSSGGERHDIESQEP